MNFLRGLTKYFFILFLVTVPTGQILRLQFPYNIAFTVSDILLAGTVIFWLISLCLSSKTTHFRYTKYIFIFIGVALISLLVNLRFLSSTQFLVSLLYLIRWGFYVCLYFITVSFPKEDQKIIHRMLFFVGAVIVFLGIIQYLFYQNLRNLYYLGWDDHLYRLFSSFLDPNFTGLFLVLFALYLGYRLKIEKKKQMSLSIGIVFGLTIVSIVLTYSRSALVSLFFVALTFLIWKKFYKWLLCFVLMSVLLFAVLSRGFSKENTNLLRTASSFARVESFQHALTIFSKEPVLGVGFNAFRYAQVRYGFRKDTTFLPNHADAGTDDSFLFIAATTGIIGFISYMVLWFEIIKDTIIEARISGNEKKTFATCLLLSIVALYVGSLFINALFYPSLMAWMWILIGIKERT